MIEKIESIHGGDLNKVSKIYGIKKEAFLDYSANINPLGIPDDLKDKLISNLDDLINYPDPECSDLRMYISKYLDISKENLIIGNGASEIIFLFFDILKPKNVVIPAPTFSEYANAAKKAGSSVIYYEIKEENEYKLDINDLIKFIEVCSNKVDTIIMCNPNNPTSKLISKLDLLYLLEFTKKKNINLIIDEAFIELTINGNNNSLVKYIGKYSNIFIIRAFTKLFAIPGLRLGYGIGNPITIREIWDNKLPWSVNSFACCIGEILFDESSYLKRTQKWFIEEKEWFYNELCKCKNLKVFKPDTNFILIKILDNILTSNQLKGIMAKKTILIRDASNFMFLTDKFIRVAIKDRKSNIKFLKVFRGIT